MNKLHYKRAMLVMAFTMLGACSVSAPVLTEEGLRQAAVDELARMFPSVQVVSSDVTLEDAVQRSVINNLENRLQRLERSFASRQVDVDSLDMLPVLAANAGYSRRSNDGYSTSQPLGQAVTGSYSRGSDAQVRTYDLSVSWSALDFALGYYNAQQAGSRAFIAEERARRAGMDVIRQAKDNYWRAYAAQALSGRVAQNIAEAEAALETIREGESSGSIPGMQALEQSRSVLENIRQLETVRQELTQAQISLSQMINTPPGETLRLRTSSMPVPQVTQSLSELEQQAFLRNPSIREQHYRTSIALTDVKRTTAELFPNLSANAQMNYSSDDFLQQDRWNTFGLNVGLNLLQLATAPQRRGLAREGVEVEEARALAVRMAVLAQTHISYRDYQFTRQQYLRARQLADVEQRIAEQSRAREAASAGSAVQRVTNETSAILSQLRVYRAYADLVSAHATLEATVGADDELVTLIAEQRRLYETAVSDVADAEQSIDALEDRIADELRTVTAMERSLVDAERSLSEAQQDAVAAVPARSLAEEELAAAISLNDDTETNFASIAEAHASAEATLAAKRSELAALEERADAARAAFEDQEANVIALQRSSAEVERESVALDRARTRLSQRVADLAGQLSAADTAVTDSESQVRTLQTQISGLGLPDTQAEAGRLSTQLDAVSARLSELTQEARDRARELSVAQRARSQAQRELDQATRSLETASQRLAATRERQAADPENERLTQQLGQAGGARDAAQAALTNAADTLRQADAELTAAQAAADAASARLAQVEADKASLQADLTRLNVNSVERDAAQLARQLASAEASLERGRARQEDLREQLSSAQSDLSELERSAQDLTALIESGAAEASSANTRMASSLADLEALEQAVEVLEQAVRAQASTFQSLARDLQTAERAVRDSAAALAVAQSELQAASEKVELFAARQVAAEVALAEVSAQLTSQRTLIGELLEQLSQKEADLQNAEARVAYYGAS